MRRRTRRLHTALASVGLLVASGCTSATTPGPPLPTGAPVIDVTMREFAFDHTSDIPAGRVVFRVQNSGESVHRLSMFPLPEDLPAIDAQLRGTERRAITPFAAIYDKAPGKGGTFAVDLVPGQRYAFVCFVVDEGGSHALKGMSSEFRAKGPAQPAKGGS